MKPLRLKWQAFGPYLKPAEIDFTALQEAIFLISGPTGGGKTSILDAMSFALYCQATGGRRDFRSMRCVSAEDDVPTLIEFDFQLGKHCYRFRRELYRRTKRGTEEVITRDRHECFIKTGEEWSLLLSGSETAVRLKAEELLHLSCEQFSQVIVLPQGEFLRFLRANSKEKGSMLETLFSVQRWESLTRKAVLTANALKSQTEELANYRKSLLEQENVTSLVDLNILTAQAAEQKQQLEKADSKLKILYETSAGKLKIAEKWERAAQTHREAAAALQKAALAAEESGKQLKQAEHFKTESEALQQSAVLAAKEKAGWEEKRQTLQNYLNAQQQAAVLQQKSDSIKAEAVALQEQITKTEESMAVGKAYVEEAQRLAEALPKLLEERTALAAIHTQYEKAATLAEQLLHLQEECKQDTETESQKQALFHTYAASLAEKEALLRNNKAAELAEHLQEGAPCPVCGSLHHPTAAVAAEAPDLPRQIQILREQVQLAQRAAIEAQRDLQHKQNQMNTLIEEYTAVQEQLAVLTNQPWEEIKAEQERLDHKITAYKKKVFSLPQAKKKLQDYLDKQKADEEKHRLTVGEAENLRINAEALLKTVPADFAGEKALLAVREKTAEYEKQYLAYTQESAEKRTLYDNAVKKQNENQTIAQTAAQSLAKAEADFADCRTEWADATPPEPQTLRTQTEQYRQESLAVSQKLGSAGARLSAVQNTLQTVTKWNSQLAALEKQYAYAAKIAQSLNGSNTKKMPILQYVLRIMLEEILTYANQFFGKLSRGRYALCLKEERAAGNAISGLDLEILDGYSMKKRSIETLSGGEQFLASLSLAFGLSDVVQQYSGAVQMDALFIDEGFGSLDQETLDIAMKAIAVLHQNGRMIGIISHVSELKQRIGAQIMVTRDAAGFSHATVKTAE